MKKRNTLGLIATAALATTIMAGCSCSRQDAPADAAAPDSTTLTSAAPAEPELTDAQKDSILINRDVPTFSATSPLTLEIKRERSYYQADLIAKRLLRMGVDAYVVSNTSRKAGDKWYVVVSGAFSAKDSLEAYRNFLDSAYNLPVAKAKTLNFAKLDTIASKPLKEVAASSEVKRIKANRPDVPQPVRDVILHMPKHDSFQLKNVSVLTLNTQGIEYAKGQKIDLPRGITLSKLKNRGCTALASAILRDNLFGDDMTIQSVRCPKRPATATSAMMPLPAANDACEAMRTVCSSMADEILKSGHYTNPTKETYVIQSFYSELSGYHVTFTDKGKPRSYFILTDQAGEYIYFGQSSRADDSDLEQILASIRTSDGGLEAYDEFHNIFYTVADKQAEGDEFIGYYTDKLGWDYAERKGNADWARKMVGYWWAQTLFYNTVKGVWSYNVFDLVNQTRQESVESLYRANFSSEDFRSVYGIQAVAVRGYDYIGELNFGIGRYSVAIDPRPRYNRNYTERDLVLRAEKLQFNPGGYNAHSTSSSSADAYTSDI